MCRCVITLNPDTREADTNLVSSRFTTSLRALLALALLLGVGAVAGRPAGAASLDELRARAQSVADEVTALERRLAGLDERKAQLADRIEAVTAEIGVLELEIHDTNAALIAAEDRYSERAVEAYKSGSTGAELEMMLSAKDLGQLLTLEQASASSAEDDEQSLHDLLAAKADAEEAQARVDEHKQELIAAQAEVDQVSSEIADAIEARHEVALRLKSEIRELERKARLEARRLAAQAASAPTNLVSGGGPAPRIPRGFSSTGVSFEGTASWYGPGFEGQSTASGQIFDSSLFTAASRDLPLGTWLYVTHEGRGVVVLVNDRGPYIDDRVLDLSQAAAEAIGISGLGWVHAEIVVKV